VFINESEDLKGLTFHHSYASKILLTLKSTKKEEPMEKIVFIIVFLFVSATSQAEIPENMPQSIYDQIIQQVIQDKGYLDMSALQESIAQWQLQQPLPITDGQLLETGNCSNCLADNQGTDNQFKKPRKVKVKAKKRSNGKYPSVLKIKWKKPKKLKQSIIDKYQVSHYLIYISKDGQSYEVLRKEAKYKKNGKLKNKQKIKFKDRTTGSYSVQVQAVYQQKTTNKNAKKPANKTSSIESFSPWSPKNLFETENKYTKVQDLTGAINSCLNANGFVDANLLTAVDPSIDCTGYNLQNADINLMANLTNIRSIIIANNPAVTNISALSNLNYLEYLDLSNNPNITLPDFSQFEELATLKLANMGLTTVPNLSNNDLLTALDLNDNAITSGFDLLPSELDLLKAKGSSYCQVNSTPVESIVVDANNLNLADCAGIAGLKFIGVDGGNFPNTTQDISAFTGDIGANKLCGLNITNTNLEQLNSTVPVEVSFHLNNNSLKYVQPLLDAANNVIPMARFASIETDSLLCSNRYKLAEFSYGQSTQTSAPINKSGTSACGSIPAIVSYYQIPSTCKPDPLPSVAVYQDLETQRRYITWEKDPALDYDLMGITEYEIKGYDSNGNVTLQRRVATNLAQVYVSYFMAPVKYSVSACNENICGYEIEDSQFSQGLSRVRNLLTIWSSNAAGPQFKFEFNYSKFSSETDESLAISEPDEFKIVSNFPQSNANDSTLLATISVPPNSTGAAITWQSPDFNYLDIIGNSFKIYACNASLGCGAATDITISLPVSSTNLPTPNWVNVSKNAGKQTQIKLEWSLPGASDNECNSATTADLDCVDYIEINEWQPKIRADSLYHQVSGTYDKYHRIYYIDKVDAPLVLSRLTYSGYDFDLRSCHRDRQNGDICSAFSGGFQQLDSQDPNCTTTKTCNLGVSDIVLNRADISISSLDTAKPINVNWYFPQSSNFNFSQIVWEIPEGIKPDYFHLKSSSFSGGHCSKSLTVDYADKIITNQGDKWVTERDCFRLKRHVTWTVQSCFNGVGCSSTVAIELNGTTPEIPDPVIRSSQNIDSPTPTNPAQAGPGGLNPGMWWNEDLAGSGWHFFFANELGNAMESSYDLIGYWYTYREMNGVWTPTWIEAKMIQKTEVNGDIFYDGSLKYYNDSPSFTEMEAGEIQLVLKANKQHATLKIKPNIGNGLFSQPDVADLGPYTQEGDEFTLEINNIAENFIEINNSAPNNDDHHSGVWHYKNPTTQELEVSVNTWIENGFEYTVFATFDTDGVPIWLTAVNICTEPNGSCNSHGGYFVGFDSGTIYGQNGASSGTGNLGMVSYGFNPLAGKPLNHDFGSIDDITTNYHGNAGRCLNLGTAQEKNKKGSFWMNLIEQLNYPASGDDPAFTRTVSNYGNHAQQCNSPADLDKVASLHNIDFKIEGLLDTDTTCSPTAPGDCVIDFTWYTDDDFPSIQPYYSINNGVTYSLLSEICPSAIPSSHYVMPLYVCDLTNLPKSYTFQLRKKKYGTSGGTQESTVVLAESKSLTIDNSCTPPTCLPSIEIIVDQATEDVNQEVTNQPGAGPIPGSGGVSGGAATYSLPLVVPPGRNGMTPSLSVNYSSKGGNGILGVGWSLSVGSSIYRCPQTLAQDTKNHAVDFSNNDRLCLDGQRLMKVSAGTYWATNAEYRTEQDSFAKITKTSASTFIVQTKSGRKNTYVQQGTQKITWQLIKEEDSFSNNIKYNYTEYGENEILLTSIFYTGNNTVDGNRSINFEYDDIITGYQISYLYGENSVISKQLKNINTKIDSNLARQYDFTYKLSTHNSNLLLDGIIEFTQQDQTIGRDLVNISWSDDNALDSAYLYKNITNQVTTADGTPLMNLKRLKYLAGANDYNGDGIKDLEMNLNSIPTPFNYTFSEFLFFDSKGGLQTIMQEAIATASELADVNYDGINDIVYVVSSDVCPGDKKGIKIKSWNHNKAVPNTTLSQADNYFDNIAIICNIDLENYNHNGTNIILETNKMRLFLKDVNNDGAVDLILTREPSKIIYDTSEYQTTKLVVYYNTSTCSSGSCPISFNPEAHLITNLLRKVDNEGEPDVFSFIWDQIIGFNDYNGDGYLDVEIRTLVQNYVAANPAIHPVYIAGNTIYFRDTNGYIKKDFDEIGLGNFSCDYYDNLGDIVHESCALAQGSTNAAVNYKFVDVNRDGLQDFLYYDSDPQAIKSWKLRLNKGGSYSNGFFTETIASDIDSVSNQDTLFQGDVCPAPDNGSANEDDYRMCNPYFMGRKSFVDLNGDGIIEMVYPDPRLNIPSSDDIPDNMIFNSCHFVGNSRLNSEFQEESSLVFLYDTLSFQGVYSQPTEQNPLSGTEGVDGFIFCSYISRSNSDGRMDIYRKARGHSLATIDEGAYRFNALSFNLKKVGGKLKLDLQNNQDTGIYKSLGYGEINDLNGNGLADQLISIGCQLWSRGVCKTFGQFYTQNISATNWDISFPDFSSIGDNEPLSVFITAHNQTPITAQISSITKPTTGQTVAWNYHPISAKLPEREDFPLYTLLERKACQNDCPDGYIDEIGAIGTHFYFNSSMYVVSDMRQTNNYGSNSLSEYAYQEAVYNNQGRGFQGFRKISVRTNPDEHSGGITYETISESTFHQVFPYAGKLEKIETWQFDSTGVLTKTQQQDYEYVARDSNQSNWAVSGVHYHPLINTISQNFELNNGNLATKSETTLTNDVYGNITAQTKTIETYDATYASITPTRFETVQTTNEYNTANTNNWWIDKLAKTTVTKLATGNSNNNHTSYSEFYWKTGIKRELDCQFTYIGTDNVDNCTSAITNNNISKNTFNYDTKGNITKVTTTATNSSNTAIDRTVDTVYSTDGYFPELITKDISGANLTTSFTYDPATGQVTKAIAPDGNYVDSDYDAYGFKITDEAKFWNPEGNTIPIAHTSLRNCNGSCPEQSIVNTISGNALTGMIAGSPQLSYSTEQRQNGQPRVITWYDNANNPVLTKTYHSDNAGFDKYSYVASITTPAGSTITTQPFIQTSSAYPTVSQVDPQGRVKQKQTKIGDLSSNSAGDCTLITDYSHQGGYTEIDVSQVSSSNNNCSPTDISTLSMSRTYDATGKLLSTKDDQDNIVKYKYDASGNPKELIDADNNPIYTNFDALGRKQSVNDPNMGIKTFQYNGFGEVIQQQVAGESYSTYYRYDKLGRITDQYSNVYPNLDPVADVRSYIDHYVYNDDRGGVLESVNRQSNKFIQNGQVNRFSQVFNKELEYDNQNRMQAEITTLPAALTVGLVDPTANDIKQYKTQYYYDGNYNRLKQVIYDYRYSIANTYTRHGTLKAQIDVLLDQTIMEVTDWNFKGQEANRVFNKIFSSTTQYYPSTGQVAKITHGSASDNEILDYQYDSWGNIAQQELARGTTQATETFTYDSLHRLKSASVNGDTEKTYSYNGIGNITSKSDFSDNGYNYAQTGNAGPNAVTSASLINGSTINYDYDKKGNRISDSINGSDTATYQYDYNNLLVESTSEITGTNQILEFNYGADNQRYRKYDLINNEITLYANKDYEAIYKNGAYFPTETKYYLTSYLTVTRKPSGEVKRNFMQKDRLGSTTQILDETGIVLHTKSYDAFGKPRNGDWSDMAGGLFKAKLDFDDANGTIDLTKRGFTDHEHLDEMQLIHMNGRMYDYNNGRFLSVDPFIARPTSTQALNPYTYINNNPLSGVDPTGYLPVIIPIIGKVIGWASAAWGSYETGHAIGSAANDVRTGEKTLGEAATDGAKNVAINAGIAATGGLAAKLANKFIPDSVKDAVKDKFKALTNGNKNNKQTSTTTRPADNSSLEANTDQNMVDNLVNKRKDTPGATGDDTFAQARGKDGELTETFKDIKDPGGDATKNIHAETQALGALKDTRGATVAVDQNPCPTCTTDLKKANVDKVIVPTKGGNKLNNSPKTAAVDAATKGKKVTVREVDLDEKK